MDFRKLKSPTRAALKTKNKRRLSCEELEDRRLLAGLLNMTLGYPQIAYGGSTSLLSYTPGSGSSPGTIDINATPTPFLLTSSSSPLTIRTPRSLHLSLQVDNTGALVPAASGDDFTVTGWIDNNQNSQIDAGDYSGTLLTGRVTGFGYLDNGPSNSNDDFNFRLIPTGGVLSSFFAGKDIGITLTGEQSSFTGSFVSSFSAHPTKGNVGPIPYLVPPVVQGASLGDFVWHDLNADGVQDAGEPGIEGVTVKLLMDGVLTGQTTTTDAAGLYAFNNLVPGNYSVQFVQPAGYSQASPANVGSDMTDSDGDATLTTASVTLASGDNNTTLDQGFYNLASLGDFVWHDANANGVQDAGEPGISGATVKLLKDGVLTGQTTTTDGSGLYGFSNLVPGNYSVQFVQPAGYSQASPANVGSDTTDSDGDATLTTASVTLASGGSNTTLDQGFYNLASLGDFVWHDANANGVQDAGEQGIPGATVKLLKDGVLTGQTTTTDGSGLYGFSNLVPGNYSVQFVQPAGYSQASPANVGSDMTDSDGDATLTTASVTLASGGSNTTLDQGFYNLASLGDFVWHDANANGVQDAGEQGIPGATVKLLKDGVLTGQTTTTDGSGLYGFSNLVPGNYSVQFVQPAGYTQVSPANVGSDTTDSDGDATLTTASVTLASGGSNTTLDQGFYNLASLGDFVWHDANANGVQDAGEPGISGVTVKLLKDGVLTGQTTTTDGSGLYGFSNLVPGNYSVLFVQPAGYTQVSPANVGSDTTDSDGDGTLTTASVTLASGASNTTLDQGFYNLASLGDFVWHDANANGVQDAGEPGISGVTVKLLKDGVLTGQTTTTDGSGLYGFSNLVPGNYSVQFVQPAGYTQVSPANVGSDTTDSDGDATLTTASVTLASGGSNTTLDQGFYNLASLGDFVWHDANANGVQDAGEPGISGVTVKLLKDGVLTGQTTTTDGSGLYSFSNLVPGNYSVQFVQPAGYSQVSPANVGSDTTDSDGDATLTTASVTLASGGSNTTLDQGFYSLVTIGNFVWNDVNANGIQEAGEAGINGVTLTLSGFDGAGNPVTDHVVTSGNGGYLFLEVPGTYTVVVDAGNFAVGGALAGFVASPTLQGADTSKDSNVQPAGTVPSALPSGGSDLTIDFGYYVPPPGIQIVKTADKLYALPYAPVTYTYLVTNTGGVPLCNVVVKDDNGTPVYLADDFNPIYSNGDADNDGCLDTTEAWTYLATTIPPVTTTVIFNNQVIPAGAEIISTVLANGNVRVTYLQDFGINDNTYGTGAIGWPNGHKFNDLVGSDHLEFRFYDKTGKVVLDFYQDYISTTTNLAQYPSGYASLGATGGDGQMLFGSASNILSYSTSMSDNLNSAVNLPNKAQLIVNSPTPTGVDINGNPTRSNWNYINSYTVEVSASVFAAGGGFGAVTVPDQHNSPSKLGVNQISPVPTNSTVTNTAIVTATAGNVTVTANDTATVHIATALGSIGDLVWNDANANGTQDIGESGMQNVMVNLLDGSGNPILNGSGQPVVDLTDGDGKYLFDNLPAGSYQVQFVLPAGFSFTTPDSSANDALDSDANQVTGKTSVFSLAAGANDLSRDAGLVGPPTPGPHIVKDANKVSAKPFEPITYTYTVTNTSSSPLSNVTVVDDNGTPGLTADDFAPTFVGGDTHNPGFLDTDETWTYTATVVPPVMECAVVNGTTVAAGTLILETLPNGDIKATYLQSQSVNDNRYGTGANAATGWSNGHKFGDLTGSDEAQFRFTDSTGKVVLDFQVDYISAATKGIFPSGTINYPSGYGTLGVSGGDGKMITGLSSNVLFASTSMTTNLLTYPTGYLVNSPTETAPLSSVSTVAPSWSYVNSYTVIVSKAAFGTAGFGGLTIPAQHNSPSKLGTNALAPTPCNSSVINTAVVTAYAGATKLTASDTARVDISLGQSSGQGAVTVGTVTTSSRTVTVPLTNTGSTSETLKSVSVTWPSGNGKLQKVLLAGKVIYDTTTVWSSAGLTITTFKGTTNDRSIPVAKAKNLVFQFEKNVLSGPYAIDLTFTDGLSLQITKAATLLASGSTAAEQDGVLGGVDAGVYLVAIDGLQGENAAAEHARIKDAMTQLNASLAPFGVVFVEADAWSQSWADVHLHVASSSILGGMDQGVLGVMSTGGEITIIDGWNWYVDADAAVIADDQYDFQTIVTHELGHAIGLGHSGETLSAMYPYLATGDVRRDLTAADVLAIEHAEEQSAEALMAAGFKPNEQPIAAADQALASIALLLDDVAAPRLAFDKQQSSSKLQRTRSIPDGGWVALQAAERSAPPSAVHRSAVADAKHFKEPDLESICEDAIDFCFSQLGAE